MLQPDEAGLELTPPVVQVEHPDGAYVFTTESELTQRQGHLVVSENVGSTGTGRPGRMVARLVVTAGIVPSDLALDPSGQWLYVGAGTHTVVVDLADPANPVVHGRIYDYMVRNHERVHVATAEDPVLGTRTFLVVTAALGRGAGCPMGTVYVYDITGGLRDRPLMIAESDVPRLTVTGQAAHPAVVDCPLPQVSVQSSVRRVSITWTRGADVQPNTFVRRDWFPYDTTTSFQDNAEFCLLVRA